MRDEDCFKDTLVFIQFVMLRSMPCFVVVYSCACSNAAIGAAAAFLFSPITRSSRASPHLLPSRSQFQPLLLLINSKCLQILQLDLLERRLIRRIQKDLGHDLIPLLAPGLKRLQPPTRTQAPLAPALEPHGPEIIAPARREIQELLGHLGRDAVVAKVAGGDLAVAVAEEAGHGRGGVERQGLLEDVEGFAGGGHLEAGVWVVTEFVGAYEGVLAVVVVSEDLSCECEE